MKGKGIDEGLRREVWERDGGKCQNCGTQVRDEDDASELIIERVLTIREIPIYRWTKNCWKCKEPTTLVSYRLEARRSYSLGDIEKLDYTLMARYPFAKKQFSRVLECEVVANACAHCGTHQSNFYLADDIAAMIAAGTDMEPLIDARIPNNLQLSDFPGFEKVRGTHPDEAADVGHVHHKDRNWQNNEPDNLTLLCRACHVKAHSR